jgi:hypothetical protein
MPSDNNLIIRSLTQTLQQRLEDDSQKDAAEKIGELINSKLYDLLNRMNEDLNETFNTLFDGPLPAVDAFALLNLNADNITGTRFPDTFRIAYLDDVNIFTRGQTITEDDDTEPFWKFGFGNTLSDPIVDPTSFLRIGALADGEFFISQNAFFDGAAWDQDDTAIDSLVINLIDGQFSFDWWDNVLGDFRNTWLWDGREQLIADFADTAYLSFVFVDDNDVIHLGESAATDTTPAGHIAIQAKISSEIPLDGDVDNDGIIIIDKTNKYLVFYTGGLRYQVTGVAYP